jgi:hypothetical protein
MRTIQAETCPHCGAKNYYYPLADDREVTSVLCFRCRKTILIAGWEASYTSEEEAKLRGIRKCGCASIMEVAGNVSSVKESVKKNEEVKASDPTLGFEPTCKLKFVKGVLHQLWGSRATGQSKWLPVPSEE